MEIAHCTDRQRLLAVVLLGVHLQVVDQSHWEETFPCKHAQRLGSFVPWAPGQIELGPNLQTLQIVGALPHRSLSHVLCWGNS